MIFRVLNNNKLNENVFGGSKRAYTRHLRFVAHKTVSSLDLTRQQFLRQKQIRFIPRARDSD